MNINEASRTFFELYFSTHIRQTKTQVAYISDIKQFEKFVGKMTDIAKINHEDIERWIASLKERGYKPASIRRKAVVLKLFFSYWVRKGSLSESPFWRAQTHFGRITNLPRALTAGEMSSLLKQTHRDYNNGVRDVRKKKDVSVRTSYRMVRDVAILEMFFATGMRVGEVSALNVNDFVPIEGSVKVKGKGGMERLGFVVDKSALQILHEYLIFRNKIVTEDQSFFLNASAQRLSPQGIANIVKKIRIKSGVEKHVTPHMLRHTVATLLLRNGVDIRVVQEFLGHASITTTQRYTHVAKDHMIRVLREHHPSKYVRKI